MGGVAEKVTRTVLVLVATMTYPFQNGGTKNILEQASEDSFPASDPPHGRPRGSNTAGINGDEGGRPPVLKLEDIPMAKCDVCGNEYDKAFTVTVDGREHTFDSFECAIHALAPTCSHCGCKVIGHGLEHQGTVFCCANCARNAGVDVLTDRV
jgi:hypothetical protein